MRKLRKKTFMFLLLNIDIGMYEGQVSESQIKKVYNELKNGHFNLLFYAVGKVKFYIHS